MDLGKKPSHMLFSNKVTGHFGNAFGLITNALEISNGLDDCHDQTQVTGGRLTPGKNQITLFIERNLHGIDLEVISHHLFGETGIPGFQCRHGVGQLLLDEPAHGKNLVADILKLLVIAP